MTDTIRPKIEEIMRRELGRGTLDSIDRRIMYGFVDAIEAEAVRQYAAGVGEHIPDDLWLSHMEFLTRHGSIPKFLRLQIREHAAQRIQVAKQPAERPNGAPGGCRLVPIRPTDEMLDTARDVMARALHAGSDVWDAMLNAAPTQSTQQPDCPHAAPHRYCPECKVSPCPIGLDKTMPAEEVRDAMRKAVRAQQPDAGEPVSDDEIMAALNKAGVTESERRSATITKWKDGIDIDYPASWLRRFAERVAVPAPQVAQTAEGEPVADAARLRALLGRARAWMETSADKPNMLCLLIDGALCRSAPPHSPIADSDIRAAYIRLFGNGDKWLDSQGSYFAEGYRAASTQSHTQLDGDPEWIHSEVICAWLHYPECWDTAAYPTLESALSEVFGHFQCQECHPGFPSPIADSIETAEMRRQFQIAIDLIEDLKRTLKKAGLLESTASASLARTLTKFRESLKNALAVQPKDSGVGE